VAEDCVEFAGRCLTKNDTSLSVRLKPGQPGLEGIEALPWIEAIRLMGDGRTLDLRPLLALETLTELSLNAVSLADQAVLGQLPVTRLSLKEVTLDDLDFLHGMTGLRDLRLVQVAGPAPFDLSALGPVEGLAVIDTPLASLDGIAGQAALSDLALAGTGQADLSPLSGLNLRRATLRGEGLVDLSFLSGSPNLGFLFIGGSEVTSLEGVLFGPAFRNLGAQGAALEDISALAAAVNLERVDLRETRVRDLSALGRKPRLEEVDLRNTPVSDLSGLAVLPELEQLWLSDTQVSDLSPLAGLGAVEQLSLSRVPATDISALAHMDQVNILWLNDNKVADLSPLLEMDALEALRVDDERMVVRERLEEFIATREAPMQ
jgi:internalin A